MARVAQVAALVVALVALGAALGWNSLTRLRQFTPDSMVYVDVARNFAAGHGLGYDTLVLNDPLTPLGRSLPVPLTTFPPLYPVVIAAVAAATRALGAPLEAAEAALAVSAACWLAILLLAWALARRAWGEPAAWLALAVLLVHAPLREAATTAWSETLAVALLLASMLALPADGPGGAGAGAPARPRAAAARAALSGLLGGLAFATRYALAPWLVLGPLLPLVGWPPATRARPLPALARAGAWAGGALVPTALVLARNRAIDGTLMPGAGPSTVPWWTNLAAALHAVLGGVVGEGAWAAQAAVVVLLVGLALVAARRRDGSLRGVLPPASVPLVAWPLIYVAFLVLASSVREFDRIGTRLMLPAGVVAVLVSCGVLARGLRVPGRAAALVLVLALAFATAREAAVARALPPGSTAQEIATSPRLAWLASHTGPRDLLVGDDMIDVAFYVRRRTVSFVDWPGTLPPTPERLRDWCLLHRGEFDRAWIVLNDRWPHARDWGRRLGPFFARLATGRDTVDAGVRPATVQADGIVYRYDPGGR